MKNLRITAEEIESLYGYQSAELISVVRDLYYKLLALCAKRERDIKRGRNIEIEWVDYQTYAALFFAGYVQGIREERARKGVNNDSVK